MKDVLGLLAVERERQELLGARALPQGELHELDLVAVESVSRSGPSPMRTQFVEKRSSPAA